MHRARELLLAGELLSPATAAQTGMVSQLLPRDTFAADVMAFAQRLARRSPTAVAALKRALTDGASLPLRSALFVELAAAAPLSHDPDTRANLRAYRGQLSSALADPAPPTLAELVARLD